MKKIIIIAVAAIALVGASIGGTLFLVGGDAPVPVAEGGAGAAATAEPAMAAAVIRKTLYYNVQPEFVVNLQSPSRKDFLMIELAIAAYDQKQLDVIDDNMPELRNELLLLFGTQKSQDLTSETGKAELRMAAREAVDKLLVKHYGPVPVADVFLTRFVMQ